MAANGSATLTALDFAKVGLTGVTTDNLPAVLSAIAATANDGSATDSLSELQTLISSAVSAAAIALGTISAYAELNSTGLSSASGVAPVQGDFAAAGVTGVDASNLNAINDALASVPVNGALANTTAEVQAIVNAYNAIFAEANGATADTNTSINPTVGQYAAVGAEIGAAASDAENLALLNDIVGSKTASDVDTIAEIDRCAGR